MKEIPLTQGLIAIVDDADYDRVKAAGKWSLRRDGDRSYAYRHVRRPDGKRTTTTLHAFITGYPLTDHRNGDGLDNRRCNLRSATVAENGRNRRMSANNTSGFRGVYWRKSKGKWEASIGHLGRQPHLGAFDSAEEAARAYDEAARVLHGEFARLNFPRPGERAA